MFHKKLRNDLENDFSQEINEQNSQRSFGNYQNIKQNIKTKKLILISQEELTNQNYQNKQNYQQNNHKDSNYQVFSPELQQDLPQKNQDFANSATQTENLVKNTKNENQKQNTNFTQNPELNPNFGQFQKNKFNKSKNSYKKTKKNSLGIIILVILIVFCLIFGTFWFWQTNLEKLRVVNKNCLENLEQNKNLELTLNCQKIDQSWQSLWKNNDLEVNYKQNQEKIETEKQNLQIQIDQINLKINKNLSTIDKLKISNFITKPDFDFTNLRVDSQTNSQQISSNTFEINSTNSSINSSNSIILQTSSSNNLSSSNNSNLSSLMSSSISFPSSKNSSNTLTQISLSNSQSSVITSSSNSSLLINSTTLGSNPNISQKAIQNSTSNIVTKSKNLKSELVQKTKYWQDLENLLKNNLEQKVITLDKIVLENSDFKELNLEDLRSFLANLKLEAGIIVSSNTDIQPIESKNDIDWNSKIEQIDTKTKEILAKIEVENTKNPDKNRQRLLKIYKNLSGEQFKTIYNDFNYTKTLEKSKEISILDDKDADNYIIKMAEKRGYQKRAQADESKLEEINGMKLQLEAKNALINLQKDAKKDGLEMTFVSGYRSNFDQKQIFVERLGNLATILSIKSGKSDAILDKLLQTTSIPGYSRHHTGYTFDLGCNSTELTIFKNTKCYEWISKDNYLNAKRFGLIPSYPEGAGQQGPDPEAWEYVWVGENLLKN